MNRYLCIVMLVLLASPVHAEWTQQNSGTTADLVDVCFVDELHGWAIGNEDDGLPVIVATEDGGVTWVQQECPIETIQLNKVFFVSESIGFIASESRINGDIFESLILRTANGGQAWEISYSAPYYNKFKDVYFIDANTGWVAGQVNDHSSDAWGGCVLSTINGGETWETQLHLSGADSTYHYSFDAVVFADEQHGWMLGNDYHLFSQPSTRLYETTDGGANWVVSEIFYNDGVNSRNIHLSDSDTLWVSDTYLRMSVNTGSDWSEGLSSPPIYDFAPISGKQGWITHFYDNAVEILYTADGGITWDQQFSHSSMYVSALDAISSQFACGVGTSGIIVIFNESTAVDAFPQPELFTLESNYPNPFNASTTIAYTLTEDSQVRISLYTATGQRVRTLCDRSMPAGRHSIVVDGSDLATGLYIARFEAQGTAKYTRMLLLK